MAMIEMRDIKKSYGHVKILDGLNLNVDEHQVVCLIGPSGCGKSTLLRCMNGLESLQGGEIRIHGDRMSGPGVDVNALRRDVGIVFQSYNLFPHMSVVENVMLAPTKVLGQKHEEAEARALSLLKRIGLEHRATAVRRSRGAAGADLGHRPEDHRRDDLGPLRADRHLADRRLGLGARQGSHPAALRSGRGAPHPRRPGLRGP